MAEKNLTNDPDLKEIRQQFEEDTDAWEEIREEARVDMRYLAGDPWEPADRKERRDNGRPCISLDELNQYTNQTINNIRQNKRDGQLIPQGFGANDKDAELRENAIRGIEYQSNAQQAYLTALQNGVERSYGFARILTKDSAVDDESWDKDIRIKRVPNPDVITIDPGYQECDASDMKRAFVLDLMTKVDFRRKFAKAKFQTFGPEMMKLAPNWIRHQHIQVAECWKVVQNIRELHLIDGGDELGDITVYDDDLKSKQGVTIKASKKVVKPKVIQRIVNGVEILDEYEWPATTIPILCCFGKEIFVDDGSGSKRIILSQVRLARDPQMLLAYLCSQECEEAGMSPKTPFVGYKGQFESDSETWKYLNKVATAYAEVDVVIDGANGEVLPLPQRPQFVPNFQAYEMAKDSARRSIQAAMGISPLPTAAQRMNEKSGVALQRIQTQEALGSYHFVDNYDSMLRNAWFQMNELLEPVMDTARDIPVVKRDGTKTSMRINDPDYAAQNPTQDHLNMGEGRYSATIMVGPNQQSEREAVSDFVDTLLQTIPAIGLPPQITAKVLAIAIQMKNLGAKGEELADIISPPDPNNAPPEAQAAIAQAQGKIQELQGQLQQLLFERKAKTVELQSKERIEDKKNITQMSEADKDREVKLEVAEITTKAQIQTERESLMNDILQQLHSQAHDIASAAVDQHYAKQNADQQAQNASALSAQNAAQQPVSSPAGA